jgi:hypothetical protein
MAVGALAMALMACGDTNNFLSPANYENVDRSYVVYALTGASTSLPAGYLFSSESVVRPQLLPTGALNFDIAFDIGSDGKARIIPAKDLVPVPPVPPAPIGMLKLSAVYDQLTKAPDKGYVSDSTHTLAAGEALVLRLVGTGCYYGYPFYAKLSVDTIDVVKRRMVIRTLIDRNCGYRSLTSGIPTS